MIDFRADLHCHTTCSDGTDAPLDLLRLAKTSNLSGLSITDHDSIAAYTPEFLALAKELEIRILTGIEISSEWKDDSVHVLGYNIDIHSEGMHTFLAEMIRRRTQRNEAILAKLKGKGFFIEMEELGKDHTVGRPHIAQVMVNKGYAANFQQAFQNYLAEGASCYTQGIKFTPEDVLNEIHKAGGKGVIAHPHFIKKKSVVRYLLTLPFQGIECYYGNLSKNQEYPWLELAKKHKLISTGGSDYHGTVKPYIRLGNSWVNEDIFNQLTS